MKLATTLKGSFIAAAAAGLFACASSPTPQAATATSAAPVKCAGVNSCAGKGQCGGSGGAHNCAGKNACKGKGWVKLSQAECDAKGGRAL